MGFTDLPAELLPTVLRHLDQKDLANICQLCRRTKDEGERQLYRSLVVTRDCPSTAGLLLTLSRDSRISSKVRQLNIVYSPRLRPLEPLIHTVMANLTGLETLHLTVSVDSRSMGACHQMLQRFMSILCRCSFRLRTLSLRNVTRTPCPSISEFLSFQIELRDLSIYTNTISPTSLPTLPLSHLNTLDIGIESVPAFPLSRHISRLRVTFGASPVTDSAIDALGNLRDTVVVLGFERRTSLPTRTAVNYLSRMARALPNVVVLTMYDDQIYQTFENRSSASGLSVIDDVVDAISKFTRLRAFVWFDTDYVYATPPLLKLIGARAIPDLAQSIFDACPSLLRVTLPAEPSSQFTYSTFTRSSSRDEPLNQTGIRGSQMRSNWNKIDFFD
ncbi:hypothetical protein JAAARDRAFT_208452 [Jaapia argillacea MUCL 33604]|uniref:F-box domain-containing protein n=1 Tax=Jaapia argillacea MUCL 33604 TaxID=933084 RepID=A0A067PWJ9_9AGAM|nr:hypothetical protein JAAARDRAFT_208452 [Jaapia argillacea MUCL 33604]